MPTLVVLLLSLEETVIKISYFFLYSSVSLFILAGGNVFNTNL